MASPMVAGVVALILDANPYLMPQQVKDIIMQTAREDNYTLVIPTESTIEKNHDYKRQDRKINRKDSLRRRCADDKKRRGVSCEDLQDQSIDARDRSDRS